MDGTSLPEVVKPDESGGIIVPQGNVDAMGKQLGILMSDPDLRRSIGERSRKTAEKYYNKDRYVNEIIQVYEKAIERKAGDKRAYQVIEQQKNICRAKAYLLPDETSFSIEKGTLSNYISNGEYKLIRLARRIKGVPAINLLWKSIVTLTYIYTRNMRRKL